MFYQHVYPCLVKGIKFIFFPWDKTPLYIDRILHRYKDSCPHATTSEEIQHDFQMKWLSN